MSAKREGFSPITAVQPIRFLLDRREVLRLLGYGPRARPPRPRRVLELVDEGMREGQGLAEPRGFFAVRRLSAARRAAPFRGAEAVAYGVCTIGRRLEGRVAELARQGQPLRALILDAVGSACVEAAADVVNAAVCEQAEQRDVFTSRRISPGYPSWPIEAQREIFTILPSRITGVSLGPRYFMEPRKSVSFALGIGANVKHSKYVSICAYCRLRNCPFRRAPGAVPA